LKVEAEPVLFNETLWNIFESIFSKNVNIFDRCLSNHPQIVCCVWLMYPALC
jgi:hypothetical protein